MKDIKNHLLLLLSLAVMGAVSCKRNDGYNEPLSTDKTKPGVVTNISVTDYNGGSNISYKLPNSSNVLYVLAKYQIRDGVPREVKASYFSDTLNVDGFAKAQEYKVQLYTVSRSDVMSDPVTVTVHPKTPVYTLVSNTATIEPDFGGVHITALNKLKKGVGIIVTKYDSLTQKMLILDQHYTNTDTIDYSVRGMNTAKRQFGVYVTDKYGNISDTLKQAVSPLFEEMLDKNIFSPYKLASDTEIGYGWELPNLWDGHTDGSSAGWHTQPGNKPPFVCSFNVGKTYKLSRFVMWERPDDDGGGNKYAFGHGNPRYFTMWGSNVASPKDAKLPVTSPVGTKVGDWINLGNFTYPNPPSGLSPENHNAADNAFVLAGVNFNFSLNTPPVHFIRIGVAQTWENGDIAHIMEVSLYGSPE
ncbi:uncharacterized protein DUF5126 [Mucilaginibacter oryzae]|uniref:Uncharacterized protein DUF5126 n=1 Tax=Mucilaginibacter oryzae TaxID=468058 RepID=A0A316HAV9_9SPHI|nr:DUF4959 domain-containing protein [Mucilaginibacter oryzae]PWK77110.1 uncharacterized protein DUF5126 [Mucilaginibacter oryzae]